jgi:DNA-directed RNA polymerase specialized sigma24 family protein
MSQSSYSTTVGLDRGALLESVRPAVAVLARRFYYRVSHVLSVELDDLIQEGMIDAWQASLRVDPAYTYEQARSYCIRAAFGAIIDAIKREDRSKAGSLEAYLAPRVGEDTPVRELVDQPGGCVASSLALRRSVLSLLRNCLTERQMLAVMAEYGIDMPQTGKVFTRDQVTARLGIGAGGYRALRSRGLRNLRVRAHSCFRMNGQPGNRMAGEVSV